MGVGRLWLGRGDAYHVCMVCLLLLAPIPVFTWLRAVL